MRHWRILLISIFIIAILTAPSFAAIVLEKQCASLYANQDPKGRLVGWSDNYAFQKFDPSKGRLLSVELNATLNGSTISRVENLAESPVNGAYVTVHENLSVQMLEGAKLVLDVIINTGTFGVEAFDGVEDYAGNDSSTLLAQGGTFGSKFASNVSLYVGTGTFKLPAVARAKSDIIGGGSWRSDIRTRGWSDACLTYTYDNTHCLSGYKKDGCTGLTLSGWKIKVNNSTHEWNTTTDASGFWQVCQLENDTYNVCEILQPGWSQTDPEACHMVTLGGINITDINFTNQRLLCVSGHKKNTCGQFNLSNWTITLSNSVMGAMSAKTNETGYYQFCGLPPGVYNLSEESKDGWSPVSAPQQITLNCSNISGMDFLNSECCGSSLKIYKTADFGPSPSNPAMVNQAINYTIIVENTGNETLYQVNVTDDKLGLRELIASLMPGEFRTYTAKYIVTEKDLCQNIINQAWANATDPCNKTLYVNATWSVPTNYTAAIKIDKRADVSSAGLGDVINYTYTVTNIGDVNLSDLKIEDDMLGMIDERV